MSAGHSQTVHGTGHGQIEPNPFKRLRSLLAPEKRDILTVVVFAMAVAILSLATPITVESLVNTVAFGVLMWPVVVLAATLMTCLGLAAAIRAMQVYVVECLQRRLFVRVVADYSNRFVRMKTEVFDQRYGPELANRFFDVLNLQKSLAVLLIDGVALVVTALVGMTVLAFYHPFLLGFDLLLLLLIAFTLFVLGWGGIHTSLSESHAKYDVAAWLEELLRCERIFKFAGGLQLAVDRADQLTNAYIESRRYHFRVVWRQTLFSLGLQVVASTALLGIGGYLVINRQLTLGQLVAAELIVALVVASVSKLGKYTETFYDLLSAAEKLGIATDLPLEREGGEALKACGRGIAFRIRGVEHISQRALPNLTDWRVEANERIALVGPPGSGKSTFFELLCGLREPGHGLVELDGIDLRSLSLRELRQQVALVQGRDLFIGTIADNIKVGRADLSYTDVREALQTVGLLTVVHALPDGLETILSASGGPLSANQALLLTLARALIGHPRLLILDGTLDSLDFQECPNLLARLFDREVPCTILIASTKPEITRMCDRIVDLTHESEPLVLAAAGGQN